jgi:hypothetical protein
MPETVLSDETLRLTAEAAELAAANIRKYLDYDEALRRPLGTSKCIKDAKRDANASADVAVSRLKEFVSSEK